MKTFLALNLSYVVFIMLINVKMSTIVGILTFMSRKLWHFNIYEQDKFCAQLTGPGLFSCVKLRLSYLVIAVAQW